MGAFLRARREALQPEDVGLRRGSRRRARGLRREEVAELCDMSADYFARLERGSGPRPSQQTAAAIARGLRLAPDERDHLFLLCGHRTPHRRLRSEHVNPGLMRVLDRLQDTPAQVMGPLGETLLQTPPAVALLGEQLKRHAARPGDRDLGEPDPADPYPNRVRRASPAVRILDIMNQHGHLADFLQARRGQLQPQEVGLQTYGERRRVPGLRREELAMLAGISAPYYTRLEQGQSRNASREVLDAVASALRLDESERAHLHALARAPRQGRPAGRPRAERITPATSALLAAIEGTPAIVVGRRSDVLAWNRQGHGLFAGHLDPDSPNDPGRRPNMAKLVFLEAHTRDLYTDWPAKARAVVGNLRLTAGRYPNDPLLAGLIGELTMHSPEFATMWADHRILACDVADYEMRHPLVGTLTVTQQTLQSPQGNGPALVVATAAPGSPSATALTLLSHATAPQEATRPRREAEARTI